MKPLTRKLFRDVRRLSGQVVTIALVVACGIAAYVSMYGTFHSLTYSRDAYYDSSRFGDVFMSLKRAPESVRTRVETMEGVSRVQTRVVDVGMIPLPDMPEPITARLISVPAHGRPALNDLHLTRGRWVVPGRGNEAILLRSFAEAHEVQLGDRLPVVINGTRRDIRIVGMAISPEFVFPISPGDIAPDPKRFAVLFMDRRVLASAFQMEGAFNDLTLSLQPGADAQEVISRLDVMLSRYGASGGIPRDKQLSNSMLSQEISGLEGQATIVPLIFLGVAAFLLNVVLSRLVHLQRPVIAALKALGYSNLSVGLHFLQLMLVIVTIGSLLGIGLGVWGGRAFTELYTQFFEFPVLTYDLPLPVLLTALAISWVAAVLGALVAVRSVVRMPPAEAMRPPPPTSYKQGVLERIGVFALLGPSARMIAREIQRRPMRLLLSAFGIAWAVGILVVGRFGMDSFDYLMNVYFHDAWREDMIVAFRTPVPERGVRELEHLPGVLRAEGVRAVSARLSGEGAFREVAIMGYPEGGVFRRLMDRDERTYPIPEEGVALTGKLGEILGVKVGDELSVKLLEGSRETRTIPVVALIDEPIGLQAHMSLPALRRLVREQDGVSMALLSIDSARLSDIQERLKSYPTVASVTRQDNMVERFEEQSGEMWRVFTVILTLFASTIAIGVIYNNARVALSMRSRDLASLRVLGFTRTEISSILIGELSIQVLLAVPLGLLIGRGLAHAVASTIDPENYRFPVIVTSQTYAFAALVAIVSGVISALLVKRKLDRLDMIGVLKTRE